MVVSGPTAAKRSAEIFMLERYLGKQPQPACIFNKPWTTIERGSFGSLKATWSNDSMSSGLLELVSRWINDNAEELEDGDEDEQRDQGVGKGGKGRRLTFFTDRAEGNGSTQEERGKWAVTVLGEEDVMIVVVGLDEIPEETPQDRQRAEFSDSGGAQETISDTGDEFVHHHRDRRSTYNRTSSTFRSFTAHGSDIVPPLRPPQRPDWLIPPTNASPEILDFYEFFIAKDWSSGPLGPLEDWDPLLKSYAGSALASPFPSLLSWGPQRTLVYNLGYANNIGLKHPHCLGAPYPIAWPEIWDGLEPVVESAFAGTGIWVDDQEMMLLRGERLEECYFSYGMIGIRGPSGDIVGLYIPNFDKTRGKILQRRIDSLQGIHQSIIVSRSHETLCMAAIEAIASNPRDMPFCALYVVEGAGDIDDGSRDNAYLDEAASQDSNSHINSSGLDPAMVFRLAGQTGCLSLDVSDILPIEIPLQQLNSSFGGSEHEKLDHPVAQHVRKAVLLNRMVHMGEEQMKQLWPGLQKNSFGEWPENGVALPIRSSHDDRFMHGVLVIGLSTRKPFDQNYEEFIKLVIGLLANGMASLKLHFEDLTRARLLAAMNRRKNEELQVLLVKKEDELRDSELKFSSSVANSPAGFWMADPASKKITYVNQAYTAMSGLKDEAGIDAWETHVHPDDMSMCHQLFEDSFHRRLKCEFRFMLDGGADVRYIEAEAGPIFDSAGRTSLVAGTLMDVTSRKLAVVAEMNRADQAQQMRRSQEMLIDTVSHELRNPLSAICLATESIMDNLTTLEASATATCSEAATAIREEVSVIALCCSHMHSLVNDVLVVSKLENDLLRITRIPVSPIDLVTSVMKIFSHELRVKDMQYELKLDGAVPSVQLDPLRVSQVLINLVTNSIKFTSQAPVRKLTVSVSATDARPAFAEGKSASMLASAEASQSPPLYVTFSVQDTGKGIRPADLGALFQKFNQGDAKTHTTYGGHGLGLFICKSLTSLMGGDIHATSEIGVGSTFSFYIPAQIAASPVTGEESPLFALEALHAPASRLRVGQATNESPPILPTDLSPSSEEPFFATPPPARNGTKPSKAGPGTVQEAPLYILLTEDNIINQTLLRKSLIKAGCIVYIANNGLEAIEQFQKFEASGGKLPLDCCLMDIEMPVMNGIEATKEIRRMEREGLLSAVKPIIAVTANSSEGQLQQIMEAGMTSVMSKPFTTVALMQAVRNACNKQRALEG